MKPLVSVIVLNYKQFQDTIVCLESLLESDYDHFNIVLVDNNSPNESAIALCRWARSRYQQETPLQTDDGLPGISYTVGPRATLVFIQSTENKGYAGGNNIGIKFALEKYDAAFYWILNNDTKVDAKALGCLVQAFSGNQRVGLISSVLLEWHDAGLVQAIGGNYYKWTGANKNVGKGLRYEQLVGQVFDIDYPNGASMMASREFVREVGLMNEMYFLYFEEIDWVTRGKRKGWKIAVAIGSKVWHKEGGTVSNAKQVRSDLSDYFILRSRLLYCRRYTPLQLPFVLLASTVFLFNRLRRKQYDRFLFSLQILLCPKNILRRILSKSR